jgi:hypothetical protein
MTQIAGQLSDVERRLLTRASVHAQKEPEAAIEAGEERIQGSFHS